MWYVDDACAVLWYAAGVCGVVWCAADVLACEQHAHAALSEYVCMNLLDRCCCLPEFRPATGIFREVAPILLRLGKLVCEFEIGGVALVELEYLGSMGSISLMNVD